MIKFDHLLKIENKIYTEYVHILRSTPHVKILVLPLAGKEEYRMSTRIFISTSRWSDLLTNRTAERSLDSWMQLLNHVAREMSSESFGIVTSSHLFHSSIRANGGLSFSIDTIDHVPLAAICYSVLHLQLILLRWRNWASINCKDTSLCSRRQSPRFNCTRNSNPLSETNESDRKRLHLQLSLQRTIEQVQMHLQTMHTNESDKIARTPAPPANDPDKKVPAWGMRALWGYFSSSDPYISSVRASVRIEEQTS